MNALEARGLTVAYSGSVALAGVDVTVRSGEVLGLIGPNGSGKTSLLDAIGGFEPAGGQVCLFGEDISQLAAYQRARRGIARTFQALELIDDLTVRENIGADDSLAARVLAELGTPSILSSRVRELGAVERRFVALARAVVGEPRLLLVDEVAAGLDADTRGRVGARLRVVAARGAGVIVVDHAVDFVLTVADRVVVLAQGRVLFDGVPAEVRADPSVIAAYLGTA